MSRKSKQMATFKRFLSFRVIFTVVFTLLGFIYVLSALKHLGKSAETKDGASGSVTDGTRHNRKLGEPAVVKTSLEDAINLEEAVDFDEAKVRKRAKAAIMGSFVADAASMGLHWSAF